MSKEKKDKVNVDELKETQKEFKESVDKFNTVIEQLANKEKPEDKTVSCKSCEAKIPEGTKYCSECGENQTDEIICKSCKTVAAKEAKFCGKCGESLENPNASIKCDKCESEIPADSEFCSNCGDTIETEESEVEKRVASIEKELGKPTPSKKTKGQHKEESHKNTVPDLNEALGRDYQGRATKKSREKIQYGGMS